jgi:hypothetical protein
LKRKKVGITLFESCLLIVSSIRTLSERFRRCLRFDGFFKAEFTGALEIFPLDEGFSY